MPPIIRAVPKEPEETRGIPPDPSKGGRGGPPTDVDGQPGRVLALDVGAKRIGIAISDELRLLARGLDTLKRQSKRLDFQRIGTLVREYGIREIVVGHPVRLGGEKSAQTTKVEQFAAELHENVSVPVRLWDERLTSVEAADILPKKHSAKEHIRERRSGAVDRIAAVVILQSYLDRQTR